MKKKGSRSKDRDQSAFFTGGKVRNRERTSELGGKLETTRKRKKRQKKGVCKNSGSVKVD